MRLSSVYSARAVWFLDIDELNPHGKRLFPDIVPALVEAFGFSIFPETPAQMDPTTKTGIVFKNGKFPTGKPGDGVVAWDFEIHAAGMAVETRDSTDTSEYILGEVAKWGIRELGLNFTPEMVRKKGYVSALVFYPEGDIAKGLQKLNEFADLLSAIPMIGEVKKRELTSLLFKSEGSDRWAFTFERRADAPFSENKYFSTSDVPTDVHVSLLTRFEALLSS
jgi:hypothetical protein